MFDRMLDAKFCLPQETAEGPNMPATWHSGASITEPNAAAFAGNEVAGDEHRHFEQMVTCVYVYTKFRTKQRFF
jgi:hypothetical protein